MARRALLTGMASALALAMGFTAPTSALAQNTGASAGAAQSADATLNRALTRLVRQADGPPGIAVVVQRGGRAVLHRAGTANLATGVPIRASDSMRLASVAKAFSGAAALSLVADGRLSLGDTVGRRLPGLPRAWAKVTLRELLQHTSGIPTYITKAFVKALTKSPHKAPPPPVLLSFAPKRLNFTPGSKYEYSNSDNIVVGLMVQAATGKSYESQLRERVFAPLGLARTSLPRGTALPAPFVHGYAVALPQPPVDVTHAFAAGWAWASGGWSPRRAIPMRSSGAMRAAPLPAPRRTGRSSRSGREAQSRPAQAGTPRGWPYSATRPGAGRCTGTPGTRRATRSSRPRPETAAGRWWSLSTRRSRSTPTRPGSRSCSRSTPSPSARRSPGDLSTGITLCECDDRSQTRDSCGMI
jgi:CubicO group peptidase (beta-lactamase class C family)